MVKTERVSGLLLCAAQRPWQCLVPSTTCRPRNPAGAFKLPVTFISKLLQWYFVQQSHRRPSLVLKRRASCLLYKGQHQPQGRSLVLNGSSPHSCSMLNEGTLEAALPLINSVTTDNVHSGSSTAPGIRNTVNMIGAHRARVLSEKTMGR